MRHSVSAGCLGGWKFIRTLTITTGNTGRRIITPIKQKSRHRFMKSIMNTMVSMVTGAWQSIWHVRDITTALQPYISTWMRSWDWDPSFVPKKQIMNRENHTRCLKTNFSRILCRIKSIKNGAQISHTYFWRTMMWDTIAVLLIFMIEVSLPA